MKRHSIRTLFSAGALFLMGAGASWSSESALTQLRSVEQLRTAFNRDAGTPRLVLLLSPT